MRKLVFVLCLIAATWLLSCNSAKKATSYTVALKYADKEDIESDHKITLVENINDVVVTSYLYEDNLLSILWNVDTDVFAFALKINRTTQWKFLGMI